MISENRHGARLRPGVVILVVGLGLVQAGCTATEHGRSYDSMQQHYGDTEPLQRPEDAEVELGSPLDRGALVEAVLARNPDLEAARYAWKASLEGYPQETGLPDPSLSYSIAPLTAFSSDSPLGHTVELGQRFPPPGTLRLQGAAALAEAEAAMHEWQAARLELALMASVLYDDYFVVARALAINREFEELLEAVRESALTQYTVGRGAQKDPVEASLALAHIEHERVILQTRRDRTIAAINRLLHRAPASPLPAPPESLPVPGPLEEPTDTLQTLARNRRQELEADRARIEAAEKRIELAEKHYWPGFGVMAKYNSMWMALEHQFMIGASVDLPIWRGQRAARVDQAHASLLRMQRLREAEIDDVLTEVETAHLEYTEARHVVRLYRERVIPTAEQLVQTSRVGYETGANDFTDVLRAEHALRRARLEYETAIASAHQALARLKRSTGEMPAGVPEETDR